MKTTILLESATRDRLKKLGVKGETYEQLLQKMIERAEAARTAPAQATSPDVSSNEGGARP